jgi:AcrR family transcriptional regulator
MNEPPEPPLAERLPSGRHGLDRAQVIANQRRRLLVATAQAVIEVGYGEIVVGDIAKRAGVSRVTLYQLFAGKTAILLAAFEDAFAALRAAIAAACATRPGWPQNLIAALEGTLAFAQSSPAQAGLLTVDALGIEPQLSSRARAANQELAELLRGARSRGRGAERGQQLPALTEEALIGAAAAVIGSRLAEGGAEALAGTAPQLAQLILTPYLGAEAAAALFT